MSIKHVIEYFRPPLPKIQRLPSELRTEFSWYQDATPDEQLIMMTMRARSPQAARRLMDAYGVETAADLLPLLPKQRRPHFRQRLKDWLMRLEGAKPTDPIKKDLKRAKLARKGDLPGHSRTHLR